MARLPSLGPRGEGWLLLQVILLIAIPTAAWQAASVPLVETPGVAAGRALGTGIVLAGLALIFWSSAVLWGGRAFSALPRPVAAGSLVESGPYRLIRHPIYAGLILAGIGVALVRVSVVVALLTLALAIVLDLKRRREEAWLIERYPGYAAYRSRTKGLIPFLY